MDGPRILNVHPPDRPEIAGDCKDQLEVSTFIDELFTNAIHFDIEKQRALATYLEALSPTTVDKYRSDQLLIWIKKCPEEIRTVALKHFSNIKIDHDNAIAVTQRLIELADNETDPHVSSFC